MKYSVLKTLKKGGEVPAIVVGATTLIIYLLRSKGVDITEELTFAIGSVSAGAYGIYRAIRNYLKNRRK